MTGVRGQQALYGASLGNYYNCNCNRGTDDYVTNKHHAIVTNKKLKMFKVQYLSCNMQWESSDT